MNVRAYSFLTPMLNACMEDINFHSLPEIHKPQQKTKTTSPAPTGYGYELK
jgi:hypothetical protein